MASRSGARLWEGRRKRWLWRKRDCSPFALFPDAGVIFGPRGKTRRRTAVGSRPSQSQTQMKLPGSLFDDRNQARALLFKGAFVAVRSSSARLMTANHKSRSQSVMITERDIAQERGKKEGIYESMNPPSNRLRVLLLGTFQLLVLRTADRRGRATGLENP